MDRLIPKYSEIYDSALSTMRGVTLSPNEIAQGYEFEKKMKEQFQILKDIIQSYEKIGLNVPPATTAYLVHTRGSFTPFSDPLTIHISDDIDDSVAALVHEYCHVLFMHSGNDKKADEVWTCVEKVFPNEDFTTKDHIIVNLLAQFGLQSVWGTDKATKILSKERTFPGLDKAWHIIDSLGLPALDPFKELISLSPK